MSELLWREAFKDATYGGGSASSVRVPTLSYIAKQSRENNMAVAQFLSKPFSWRTSENSSYAKFAPTGYRQPATENGQVAYCNHCALLVYKRTVGPRGQCARSGSSLSHRLPSSYTRARTLRRSIPGRRSQSGAQEELRRSGCNGYNGCEAWEPRAMCQVAYICSSCL